VVSIISNKRKNGKRAECPVIQLNGGELEDPVSGVERNCVAYLTAICSVMMAIHIILSFDLQEAHLSLDH
jgi:hypothetical protein